MTVIDHCRIAHRITDTAHHHLFRLRDLRRPAAAEPESRARTADQRQSDSDDEIDHIRHFRIVYDRR